MRYDWGMSIRFRLGLVIGFGTGYYLGAKAGHERYKQIRQFLDRASRSEIAEKAKAGIDLAVERVREARHKDAAGVGAGGGPDLLLD